MAVLLISFNNRIATFSSGKKKALIFFPVITKMVWFLLFLLKRLVMMKRYVFSMLAVLCFTLPAISLSVSENDYDSFKFLSGEEVISIYPNPAKDQLKIEFQSDLPMLPEIHIIDLTGKVIKKYEEQMNLEQDDLFRADLDISMLPPGVYFVKVIQGKNIISKKLMVN